MCRVMVTWLAIGLAIGLISQVQADDGDPWTPGQDKPGTSISVVSNDDGVTIYIAIDESSPGSSSVQARCVASSKGALNVNGAASAGVTSGV